MPADQDKKYFGKFKFKKAFLEHRFQAKTIRNLAFAAVEGGTWPEQKLVMRHPQCPLFVLELYANHPRWYVRIVAMLNQTNWRRFIERAMQDKKSTVRFCAYRRAIHEGYNVPEVHEMIKKDKDLRGYRRMLLNQLGYSVPGYAAAGDPTPDRPMDL